MNENNNLNQQNSNKICESCGTCLEENDKFCVKCGKAIDVYKSEIRIIKEKIAFLFEKNTVLNFIKKYSYIFAWILPIYLILSYVPAFDGLVKVIDYIDVVLLYLFYISLLMLFVNNKQINCICALATRGASSVLAISRAESLDEASASCFRLIMVIILIYFVYCDYKKYANGGN